MGGREKRISAVFGLGAGLICLTVPSKKLPNRLPREPNKRTSMKRIRNVAIVCCLPLLLSHCASQDEVRDLNYQLRAVNRKVEDVKTQTVDQLQKRQASSVSKVDDLQNQILQLQSRFEETAHLNSQLKEQTKETEAGLTTMFQQMNAGTEERLRALEERVDNLAASLDSIKQARLRSSEKQARDAARRAEKARQRAKAMESRSSAGKSVKVNPGRTKKKVKPNKGTSASKQPKAVSAKTATASAPGGDPLSLAISQFKAKKYKDAYSSFEHILSSNPKGDKAAETLFFMGECLYNQKEFDLAILDYQKVISNHPKNKRAPEALLKQGMSFEKLTDHETAKIIYKKLSREYAGSSQAETAKQRLGNL